MKHKRELIKGEGLYYLRDDRQVVGNCLLWWGKGRSGYTCNLDNAQVFTKEEAFEHHRNRSTDRPYPKDVIDRIAFRHVDHQVVDGLEYLPEEDAPHLRNVGEQPTTAAAQNTADTMTGKAIKHQCPTCDWTGTEREMKSDYDGPTDDEWWSNWICPKCGEWHMLEDYSKVKGS